MSLLTIVKMGAVNNLSDARFAAGCDVDFIGFCLSPSVPRYIEPDQVKEITGWVEGPEFVAEMQHEPPDKINDVLDQTGFPIVQVDQHYEYSLSQIGGRVIQRLQFDTLSEDDPAFKDLSTNQKAVEYFIVEFSHSLAEQNPLKDDGNISFVKNLCDRFPLLLDLPFHTDNILPLLSQLHPAGINLRGGDEVKPGYRDFDELIDLLEMLEQE